MSIPEDVTAFLRKNSDKAYCDDCLKDNLKLKRRQQAQRVTDAISETREFHREKNTCADCREHKYVTKAIS